MFYSSLFGVDFKGSGQKWSLFVYVFVFCYFFLWGGEEGGDVEDCSECHL